MMQRRDRSGSEPSPPNEKPVHAAPSISLPKGGGALRAIDEKFSVNAANGTCELSIPLPFSKTRGGIDGATALHYNSGSGNGPFGLGWSLQIPSIARRTDKRLPRYDDDADVFLLAGAEDLVPALIEPIPGGWQADVAVAGPARVVRYRPRIEGAFSRIEQIRIDGQRGSYWKVTTRDNVVTIYGRAAAARIAAPDDDARIFRWLPQWTYDDKGNCAEFVYKPEDLDNVPDVVEERNRRAAGSFSNAYLKRIRYGNKKPYLPDPSLPFDPPPPAGQEYFFEAVLDYGEHDGQAPAPGEVAPWPCRFDPFSDCRAGFDVRTYRLCRRILFFHTFTELGAEPCLVRSVDLRYRHFQFDGAPYRREEVELLLGVERVHYRRTAPGAYARRGVPPAEFHYHPAEWSTAVSAVAPEDVVHAPAGVGAGYQFVDLDGYGVPGILSENERAWYYKRNLGDGHFARAAAVTPKPSAGALSGGTLQFQDLDADARKQVVVAAPGLHGYFELDDDGAWEPFRAFERTAPVDGSDPNVRLLDLDGDGRADLLISEELVFRWYPSLGTRGYDAPRVAGRAIDEEQGPAVIFADGTQTIFIADMNGDGLADIVRVRNQEVCYWPSLGYGRFGAKVAMASAPWLDHPDSFEPRAVQFADISGTGAADLIYLGRGGFRAWLNLAGNAWSEEQTIDPFPGTERPNRVAVLDLLGNGTASLVWSSDLPANAPAPLRYVDLMGGRKPYVLDRYANNLGAEARIEYRSSTHFALLDQREGRPWATRLPFPTMCVSRTETRDAVSGARMVRQYRYRHGYYDHAEREFRGFGMVEEIDSEDFDRFRASGASNVVPEPLHQAPVRTRTWFHTGAFIRGAKILHAFAGEYFATAAEPALPDAVVDAPRPLTPEESRQATRACKGMMLRQEVYADDGSPRAALPYSTAAHNCAIRMLQPAMGGRGAVFFPIESEAVTVHYERDLAVPRVAHTLNTRIDDVGNVLESAAVVYGRGADDATLPAEVQDAQRALRILYTANQTTNDVRSDLSYRLRQQAESRAFELTGAAPAGGAFRPAEIRALFAAAAPIGYEETPDPAGLQKRLLHVKRALFASDADPNVPVGSPGTELEFAL